MSEPRFYSHNSVYRQEGEDYPTYSLDEIQARYLPDIKKDGIVASDMDGSMFYNDLGIHVFLEQLSQPQGWVKDPGEFARLLTPDSYQVILKMALAGQVKDISREQAEIYVKLRDDCIDLYKAIYAVKRKRLTIENPLVNEFARKMLELDRMGMEMEQVFMIGNDGQILSRTRFFVEHNPWMVTQITTAAMRSHENGGRYVDLKVYPKNDAVAEQRISEHDLEPLRYDKQIVVVEGTRHIIQNLFDHGNGVPVRIVTTNLKDIAEAAIEASPYYKGLLDQDCDGKSPILASKLVRNDYGKMGQNFWKLPILGGVKGVMLRDLEEKMKRKVRVAIADSPTNDGAMVTLTLRNGGVAFFVRKYQEAFEETRNRFKVLIDGPEGVRRSTGDKDVGDRIFYV
ncbi:hypothetical protein JXD20_00900 [Candidatus Peregrinibacteria bacterium]|nr:hypothetical protein [Candidatus Peregrinibacteria bacterium]